MNHRIIKILLFVSLVCLVSFSQMKQSLDGVWMFKADSLNKGAAEQWFLPAHDKTDWVQANVPAYWETYPGLSNYDGAGWFARKFQVADLSQPLSLYFHGVDDNADVWVNGKFVGSHIGYSEPFSFPLTDVLHTGENDVVIRVFDNGGLGGFNKSIALIGTADVKEMLRTKWSQLDARRSEEWVKDAIIYEVYLRSFSKEGTFKACEQRLLELKKLGVSIVWLMPIHPVGKLNRKGSLGSPYSVQDYYGINPEFGTMDDFKSLLTATHKLGMKLIIDLVANHTAWDSPMLQKHPEWYTHDTSGRIIPPNPDWTDVADLNYDNKELRRYMIDMMEYWVKDVGIDGFRCDVAEMVPTDFWEDARRELDAIKPIVMLAEGSWPEQHVKAFDLTYSWNVYDVFPNVLKGERTPRIFDDILSTESYQFPRNSLRMRFNTNHDKNAWEAPAVQLFTPTGAKLTAVMAFTFPGVPLIYNGEEVGNNKKLELFEKVDIDWSKGKDFRMFYEQLGAVHQKHPALKQGLYTVIKNSDSSKVFSFLRTKEEDKVLVVMNWSHQPVSASLNIAEEGKQTWKDFFTGIALVSQKGLLNVSLPASGFMILENR